MDTRGFKTRAVREGQLRTNENEHNDPIFATSSFIFHSAEHAAELFADSSQGNVYSRFTNPTIRTFEKRLASLENAHYCVATASGMSAIMSLCLTVLQAGDQILASRGLFGSTTNLFNNILSKFNIDTQLLSPNNLSEWTDRISKRTKILFIESPSNPLCEIVDISALAKIARTQNQCLLVVDNCACTPALQRPLDLGADVVIHSSTKFLDGQGRGVGGAIVTNEYKLADRIVGFLRTAGPSMSPFNAWIFLKGLETLAVRMQESCKSANKIANWLSRHVKVRKVYYPGLKTHMNHELASQQQSDFGAILSFEVEGGKSEAWRIIDSLSIFTLTANFGDAKSTVCHPASTTHARISENERQMAGITDGLVRISIGLENADDLIVDLESGLSLI